jgi:hypothetical protein
MKSLKLAVVAISLIGVFGVGNAMAAADTNILTINANVVGTCKFVDATSTLNLGALPFDANGASAGTSGNLDISFWCTKGVVYTIGDSSLNTDSLAGLTTTTELIPYTRTLTGDTGTGNGASSPETLNVKVDIAAGDYDAVSAQNYQDVVTLSFTP